MDIKQQFLSPKKSSGYEHLSENKIELLVCHTGSNSCKEPLSMINKCYVEAHGFHLEKDYLNSIESLKNAFLRTCDLQEESCIKCAELFRSTIKKSLEDLNGELQRMTSGIIINQRYRKSYKNSSAFLNEIEQKF